MPQLRSAFLPAMVCLLLGCTNPNNGITVPAAPPDGASSPDGAVTPDGPAPVDGVAIDAVLNAADASPSPQAVDGPIAGKPAGTACTLDGDCSRGHCAGGLCCDTACASACSS